MSLNKTIDFRRGHPNPLTCHPYESLAKSLELATKRVLEQKLPLGYGDPRGNSKFLKQLRLFINRRKNQDDTPCRLDGLFVTNGVSHGIDLVCRVFTKPGDICLVEDATYFLAADILKDNKVKIESIKTDEFGIDVVQLENDLKNGRFKSQPSLLYTIPINSNPSGATLSIERREKLVELANKYKFVILADEVYHFLDWNTNRPNRMIYFDKTYISQQNETKEEEEEEEREDISYLDKIVITNNNEEKEQQQQQQPVVISVSSFTKILSPSLRLGWIEAHPDIISKIANIGYIISGGGVNPFTSEIIAETIETREADKFLDLLISNLQKRSNLLCELLKENEINPFVIPTGGYFVWCKLPKNIQSKNLLTFAEKTNQVSFLPGPRCDAVDGIAFPEYIRLCFAYLNEEEFEIGVKKISDSIKNLN